MNTSMHARAAILVAMFLLVGGVSGCDGEDTSNATTFNETRADAAFTNTPQEVGTVSADVDRQIRDLMDRNGIPSLSAAIVVDYRLVWAKNYDGPAGLDTVYVPDPCLPCQGRSPTVQETEKYERLTCSRRQVDSSLLVDIRFVSALQNPAAEIL